MRIIDEKGLSGYVKKLLNLVFLGGIGILLCLPYLLNWYLDRLYYPAQRSYYFLLFFLYFTGAFCLWIIYEMIKIFKTLNRKNPFMMDNVISLQKTAFSSFIIAAAYIVKIIFYNSFLTMVITMIFVIAGLFLTILSEVFKQAVEYKEENDLTI
jgi:hypothetical protein